MGRHPGAQYAAPALVAVVVLRHDRLVRRILDRVSGMAAGFFLQQRPVQLAYPQRRGDGPRRIAAATWADDGAPFRGFAARDRVDASAAGLRPRAWPPRLC